MEKKKKKLLIDSRLTYIEQYGDTFLIEDKCDLSFLVVFDDDFGGICVSQKTYWGDLSYVLYDNIKENHSIIGLTYPESDEFFDESP